MLSLVTPAHLSTNWVRVLHHKCCLATIVSQRAEMTTVMAVAPLILSGDLGAVIGSSHLDPKLPGSTTHRHLPRPACHPASFYDHHMDHFVSHIPHHRPVTRKATTDSNVPGAVFPKSTHRKIIPAGHDVHTWHLRTLSSPDRP